MHLSRTFSLSFLTCKTELAGLLPELREEVGTGSPRHEGQAEQGSGGPGGWEGTGPASGERERAQDSKMVGVEDAGPAGRPGTGAGPYLLDCGGLAAPQGRPQQATDL